MLCFPCCMSVILHYRWRKVHGAPSRTRRNAHPRNCRRCRSFRHYLRGGKKIAGHPPVASAGDIGSGSRAYDGHWQPRWTTTRHRESHWLRRRDRCRPATCSRQRHVHRFALRPSRGGALHGLEGAESSQGAMERWCHDRRGSPGRHSGSGDHHRSHCPCASTRGSHSRPPDLDRLMRAAVVIESCSVALPRGGETSRRA